MAFCFCSPLFLALRKDYFAQSCVLILCLVLFGGIFAPIIAPFDPSIADIQHKYLPISTIHWLGTDNLGRDTFSRLVFGIRTTVFYTVIAMLITLFIGAMVGMYAATAGGKTDEMLMRFCDMMLSFPSEVMILALVGLLGAGLEHILAAIILVKWAWYARMIRGVIMQYRHKNYVSYSQVIGKSKPYILWKHLFPVVLAEMAVLGSVDMGGIILMVSALSFLGLGVQPPVAEWGTMLSDAKNAMLLYPEQMLPAGIAIIVVVVACNGVGDFLRDVFDPDRLEQ